jgi:NAD-dependent SIR2 family protein deacetylase
MKDIDKAAEIVKNADALLIGAGAGMGVDSGLPDFRGDQGFWRAYPPYKKLGLNFVEMANPDWFSRDPELGWGFYGHRLNLYRITNPHKGFQILREWGAAKPQGFFVFTSNVDGQFQRAGFPSDRIVEIHGAIDWLQCTAQCGIGIYECNPSNPRPVAIDEQTMRAVGPLPSCPKCGAMGGRTNSPATAAHGTMAARDPRCKNGCCGVRIRPGHFNSSPLLRGGCAIK